MTMVESLEDLPRTYGEYCEPAEGEYCKQASPEELEELILAALNQDDITAIGWQQVWMPVESEPESWEARCIWFRTTNDEGKPPHELGVFYDDHPTLGRFLYGENPNPTPTQQALAALWEALRESTYRDALIHHFGTDARVTITKEGITIDRLDYDHDWR